MSFLDKFKRKGGRDKSPVDEDFASIFDEVASADDRRSQSPPLSSSMTLDMNAATQITSFGAESSMLSEAQPSEAAGEFGDTRAPGTASAGSVLPIIGGLALAQQQRLLAGVVAASLVALVIGTFLAIQAANDSATQVGAVGQARLQSQRLARSVSQALVGNAAAFAETRDSAQLLALSVRGLKDGSADIAPAPSAAQSALDPLMPLIDRAEKSALIVMSQQKTLTRSGEALRVINRRSPELLETAEAVLSLKQQQDAAAVELLAAAKIVMLTQRIGKSAIEFLTTEGVSPEAV